LPWYVFMIENFPIFLLNKVLPVEIEKFAAMATGPSATAVSGARIRQTNVHMIHRLNVAVPIKPPGHVNAWRGISATWLSGTLHGGVGGKQTMIRTRWRHIAVPLIRATGLSHRFPQTSQSTLPRLLHQLMRVLTLPRMPHDDQVQATLGHLASMAARRLTGTLFLWVFPKFNVLDCSVDVPHHRWRHLITPTSRM
jgi:hypothetical protein